MNLRALSPGCRRAAGGSEWSVDLVESTERECRGAAGARGAEKPMKAGRNGSVVEVAIRRVLDVGVEESGRTERPIGLEVPSFEDK